MGVKWTKDLAFMTNFERFFFLIAREGFSFAAFWMEGRKHSIILKRLTVYN